MSERPRLQDDSNRETPAMGSRMVENQNGSERRGRYGKTAMGVTAVIAVGAGTGFVSGAISGAAKALGDMNPVTTKVSTDGGKQEIIKQDLDFVETCWTATTVRVTDASAKLEVSANAPVIGETSVGWTETTVDMNLERSLCMDPGKIDSVFNPNTEQLTLTIDDKESIRTETEIVPGTHEAHTDNSPSFAAVKNSINLLESTPGIEDSSLAQNMAKTGDKQSNALRNIATINAMYDNACEQPIWDTTKEAVEYGIENVVFRGLQYDHPGMTREDITVLVEGTEISKLKIAGETSSIDSIWKNFQTLDKNSDNLSVDSGKKGTCVTPPEVKDPASVFNASGDRGNES